MKNKLVFAGLLIGVLAIIFTAGCATDPNAPQPYQFDGTSWTKTEDYELVFKGSKWELWCGSEQMGWWTQKDHPWKVDGNTLTFGSDGWGVYMGHAAGVWTLKSGTPKSDSLDGTTWTRTAVLEIRFENGRFYETDGNNEINFNADGDKYASTSKRITITTQDGTAGGTYVVDGNTLTVTANSRIFATRLQGTPWIKK